MSDCLTDRSACVLHGFGGTLDCRQVQMQRKTTTNHADFFPTAAMYLHAHASTKQYIWSIIQNGLVS